MLGWFKMIQEVTVDLPKVAKIILMQNPNSLKWAKDRLWEFARLLVDEYALVPDRNANGLDWTGSYQGEEEDDLVFFDHHYGALTNDPYEEIPVSLRLSLQCYEGAYPISFLETRLSINVYDPKNEMLGICCGHIDLIGQRGVWWRVKIWLSCSDETWRSELEEHFGEFIELDPDGCDICGYRVSASQARDLLHLMATFFKKHN